MFYNPQLQSNNNVPIAIKLDGFDSDVNVDLDLDLDLDLNIDLDADSSSHSASSSPQSTQSLLYQLPGLSAFDSVPAVAASQRGSQLPASSQLSMLSAADLMHPDSWLGGHGQQLAPRPAGRASHHRESSLSSLGSAGPASPFSQNTSNPHIAVTDSGADGYHGLPPYYDDAASYPQAKHLVPSSHDAYYLAHSGYAPDAVAPAAYPSLLSVNRQRGDRELLPPPELSIGSGRSRPVSVASSVAGDSPATPSLEQPEDDRRRRPGFVSSTVPKLDRTFTDICADELYSPSFAITSTTPSQVTPVPATSTNYDMFSQRLQAINTQHLNVHQSPVSASSRDKSPFRHGSPLAPKAVHDFAGGEVSGMAQQMRFNSAQQLRERRKADQDAQALQQQLGRNTDRSSPQTISPKDAVLELHDTEGVADFPLFPQQGSTTFEVSPMGKDAGHIDQTYGSMGLDGAGFNYLGSQLPSGLQVPQQYPFVAQPRQSSSTASMSAPSRVSSAESVSTDGSARRPAGTSADGGTYTCTYHGCTLRFDTPALLQRHKREGHRQAHGLNGARRGEGPSSSSNLASSTGGVVDSQAGPHRCDRINPSTGKPCNTVFSRPYDLTRHEDTIHNARKQKVRCSLCTEEKTFSRADALTRHFRVCHPDVNFPGKHRRRGGGHLA